MWEIWPIEGAIHLRSHSIPLNYLTCFPEEKKSAFLCSLISDQASTPIFQHFIHFLRDMLNTYARVPGNLLCLTWEQNQHLPCPLGQIYVYRALCCHIANWLMGDGLYLLSTLGFNFIQWLLGSLFPTRNNQSVFVKIDYTIFGLLWLYILDVDPRIQVSDLSHTAYTITNT